MLNTESSKKMIPDQNTAPSACCQGIFKPSTAEKVKKAFKPMPGATRMGLRAYKPIIMLLKKQTSIVAVDTAGKDIPVWLNMAGLTTIIYAVARKLDNPAIISV